LGGAGGDGCSFVPENDVGTPVCPSAGQVAITVEATGLPAPKSIVAQPVASP